MNNKQNLYVRKFYCCKCNFIVVNVHQLEIEKINLFLGGKGGGLHVCLNSKLVVLVDGTLLDNFVENCSKFSTYMD